MTEKQIKTLYEACNKAVKVHCKRNSIPISEIELVIKEGQIHEYYYCGKLIMKGYIVDEPKIEIRKMPF